MEAALYFLIRASIGMITPWSAKSGNHAGDISIESSAPDLARCSAITFVRISANGASVTSVLIPVSFSQSGPEKFLSSSAWGPASLILPSVIPSYCFAALTAPLAIGSRTAAVPVDASIAAAACSVLSHVGAAAAAAAASPLLRRKSRRAIRSPDMYSSCGMSGSWCTSSLTPSAPF